MGDKKTRNPPISPEDRELFHRAVGKVTPVSHDRVVHKPARKGPPRRPQPEAEAVPPGASALAAPEPVDAEQPLYYLRNSLPRGLIRQVKRGQHRIDARIDLHGLTWPEAERYLQTCLDRARAAALRCLLVIHGKGYGSDSGQPVLKNMLNGWLRHQPGVLMFCSAQPADGGNGAIYLLLQQPK